MLLGEIECLYLIAIVQHAHVHLTQLLDQVGLGLGRTYLNVVVDDSVDETG